MNKRETPDRLSTQSGSFWLHAKRSFRRITIKVVLLTVVLLWVFHAVTTPVMGQGRRPVTGQTVFKFPENPSSRFGTVITYSISGAEITEVFDRLQEPSHMGMYAREFQRENFGVRTGGERIALNGVIKAQQVQMVSELLISLECASSRDVIKMSVPYEDGVVHRTWDYPFNLSVSCPTGERFSMFIGVWIRHGDTMDYSEGFRISGPPAAWEPYPSTTRVGINGLLPGPETLLQALLGVLGPGLLAILIGLLGGHLPTYPPLPGGGPGPSEYVLSDGRTYREGQTYTFDDGRQYRFINGEFVPVRDLQDGDVYLNPDGDRKIWIGGQSWYEEDWRRQAATNEEYRQAHEADWAIESTRLNPDLVAAHQQYQTEDAAADALNKIQELALRHGMAADGAEDNMYGRAVKLLEQIRNGEQPDFDKIARMRSYIGNRISGFTPGPGEYPPPEKSWWADNGAWSDALVETGRNLSQGKNSDGSTSWIGLAGRLGIGILTKGASEWAFVPMSSTYTMKNAVESGASGLSATVQAITRALVEDMVGRGIGIGISGASGAWKGGMSGGWQGLKSAGSDQLRQAGDLFSGKAWKATGQSLANSVSNGSQRFMDIVRLREGYTGPGLQQIKKGAQKGLDQALGRKPQLSAAEHAKLKQFNNAVNSGDPKKVAELYKDGGMKQLSELQKKGVIPPESARKCNSMLKTQVDESIREGTRNAIIETQKKTHVRVKEVIVADSGSSAKGQVTRLPTDADRTLIPEFNKRDLNWYAKSKNMTTAEAYNELSRQLNESHKVQVNRALKKNAGVTAKDVDFGSYDRIGSASGQSDSYPTSFTNARTAVDGASEVTRVSADGTKINKPYKTSGQAAVDANQLKLRKYGTDIFDPDPTRILPADTKPVLKQQIQSIFKGGKSGNPEALAKSVERFHKQATIGQYSTKDGVPDHISVASKNSLKQASERMVSTSRLVRNTGTDPSQLIEIAKQNGYSSVDEFIQECIDFLKYAESEFTAVA